MHKPLTYLDSETFIDVFQILTSVARPAIVIHVPRDVLTAPGTTDDAGAVRDPDTPPADALTDTPAAPSGGVR